jgi:hypothetical protein
VAATCAAPAVGEAAAVMLRMTESVADVERRWKGTSDRGGAKDDLKVLVLVEDQVSGTECALCVSV